MKRLSLALLLVAGGGGTAAAEPVADRVHDFHSMDTFVPASAFHASFSYEALESSDLPDVLELSNVLAIDVGGQYLVPGLGLGGYVAVPMSYISFGDSTVFGQTIEGDSTFDLGNIEVGGVYARPLGGKADLVAHLGVGLPTAADDDPIDAFQPLAALPRLGDYAQRWPNVTWLRLGASGMGRAGLLFWRVDLGADFALADDNGADEIAPLFHANVGAGVDLGQIEVSGELVNSIGSSDADDDSASALTLGARFGTGSAAQPGIALVLPLSDAYDNVNVAITASVTAKID